VRPHSAIGNLPPAIYAKLSDPAMQRDGSLRSIRGSHPVAPPSQTGSNLTAPRFLDRFELENSNLIRPGRAESLR
jgi:hypothetical protein